MRLELLCLFYLSLVSSSLALKRRHHQNRVPLDGEQQSQVVENGKASGKSKLKAQCRSTVRIKLHSKLVQILCNYRLHL